MKIFMILLTILFCTASVSCRHIPGRTKESEQMNGELKFDAGQFEARIAFSEMLLEKQPSRKEIEALLPADFTIDSLEQFKYSFKYRQNQPIIAWLNIETFQIVYVEFFEKQENLQNITDFLVNKKNYEYLGSEHMVNYYNNKKTAVSLSPGTDQGIAVHVSRE